VDMNTMGRLQNAHETAPVCMEQVESDGRKNGIHEIDILRSDSISKSETMEVGGDNPAV